MSIGTHSASWAMPALPGAHHSFVTSGEAAIFHANACSRPPEPITRIFMESAGCRGCSTAPGSHESASFRKGDRLFVTSRSSNDLLQGRDMPGKRAAAGGRCRHCGLRLLADKGLFHRDVAGFRQRLDMSAEIAVGGAGEFL